MQIKITTDYAIRILLCLAQTNRITSAAKMAQTMHIPPKYLSKIIFDLKNAGMVSVQNGTHGGYRLAKSPQEINLYEIMEITENKMKFNRCLEEDGYCNRGATQTCPIRRQYLVFQSYAEKFLKEMTLQHFLDTEPLSSPESH